MSTKRYDAGSVTISDSILWVSGGSNQIEDFLSSSDYVQVDRTMPGPELPIPLTKHAMVNIGNDLTIVMGGANIPDHIIDKPNYEAQSG